MVEPRHEREEREFFRKNNIPWTRQDAAHLNHWGEVPSPWTWEHEEELPSSLRIAHNGNKFPPPLPARAGR